MATFLSSIKNTIRRFTKRRFNRWLKRRIPSASQHKLSNRNIFILPTRFGFAYLFFVVLLFLLATNYQNNVIMLLSYLMASVFITSMMHSFYNISGLTLSADKMAAGFAKQNISFPIKITSSNIRADLNFSFDNQPVFHLPRSAKGQETVYVCCKYKQRGVFQPGRLKVSSEYSFGLFITWTKVDFDHRCFVYPEANALSKSQRNFSHSALENSLIKSQTREKNKQGIDDFFELKPHAPGEPLTRIAWKHFARGQGRLTKHYHQHHEESCWLNLADMPAHGIEKKLQYLCFLVNEYNATGQIFGLDLGQKKIKPSQGTSHFKHCLMALAIYPSSTDD